MFLALPYSLYRRLPLIPVDVVVESFAEKDEKESLLCVIISSYAIPSAQQVFSMNSLFMSFFNENSFQSYIKDDMEIFDSKAIRVGG